MLRPFDTRSDARYDTRMWASKPYRDAVAIQALIASDAKSQRCKPRDRCLLARAFVELETLKLRLKMKPAPKPIDVSGVQKATRRAARTTDAAQFTELAAIASK